MNTSKVQSMPTYVRLQFPAERGSCLRLKGSAYFRDAGCWTIQAAYDDSGVLRAVAEPWMKDLDGVEMIPVSEEEWRNDNAGYLDRATRAT